MSRTIAVQNVSEKATAAPADKGPQVPAGPAARETGIRRSPKVNHRAVPHGGPAGHNGIRRDKDHCPEGGRVHAPSEEPWGQWRDIAFS